MPLQYLIALFIGLPIIELALLLKVHEVFHFWPTFLLVVLTGATGLSLVKQQGISIIQKIQRECSIGNLPTPQLMDGVMILISGALLITPGLITDIAGFALLVPFLREQIRAWLRKKLEQKIRSGYVEINTNRSDQL